MAAFVKVPRARAINAGKIKETRGKINVPGGDCTHNQPVAEKMANKGPGNVFLPLVSAVPEGAPGPVIPIRICPHCGYEIRTWILGDLTCTRCENDISTAKGGIASLYYRVSDISYDTGFPVRSENPPDRRGSQRVS